MQRLKSLFSSETASAPVKVDQDSANHPDPLPPVNNADQAYRNDLQVLSFHQGRSAQALSDLERDLDSLEKCYSSNFLFPKMSCYEETKSFFELQDEYKKLDAAQSQIHSSLFQDHKTPTSAKDEVRSLKIQQQECVKEMDISARLGQIVKANKFFTHDKQEKFDQDLAQGWDVCKKMENNIKEKSRSIKR